MPIFKRETPRDNTPTGRVAMTGKTTPQRGTVTKVAADYRPKR